MPSRVELSGHGFRFWIELEAYERPFEKDSDYHDLNWVVGTVGTEIGDFSAIQPVTVLTVELDELRNQLERLDETLTGQAELSHIEDHFAIAIELSQGRGTVSGHVVNSGTPVAELSFRDVAIDQSSVAQTLRELTVALQEFPIRHP